VSLPKFCFPSSCFQLPSKLLGGNHAGKTVCTGASRLGLWKATVQGMGIVRRFLWQLIICIQLYYTIVCIVCIQVFPVLQHSPVFECQSLNINSMFIFCILIPEISDLFPNR
jgi:hypothetical protein